MAKNKLLSKLRIYDSYWMKKYYNFSIYTSKKGENSTYFNIISAFKIKKNYYNI